MGVMAFNLPFGILFALIMTLTSATTSYTYMGCFVDSQDRALPDDSTYDFRDTMTPSICVDYCQSKGYPYAGVQYGYECFCGSQEPCPFIKDSESNCSMPCSGDSSFMCGNAWRSSVYTTSDIVEPPACDPVPVANADILERRVERCRTVLSGI